MLAFGGGAIGTVDATYQSDGPPVAVRLGKSDPIDETVRDADGRPVAGARVRIWRIGSVWVRPSADADRDPDPIASFWPKAVVTDKDGKFSFPGLGGLSPVIAEMLAPGYVRTDTRLSGPGMMGVHPPKWVSGNVRAASTRKPVAGTEIGYPARFSAIEAANGRPLVFHRVGRDGSFRLPVPQGDDVLLVVKPPAGSQLHPLVQRVDLDGREQADVQLSLTSADR
jgi:hypothetical protein